MNKADKKIDLKHLIRKQDMGSPFCQSFITLASTLFINVSSIYDFCGSASRPCFFLHGNDATVQNHICIALVQY